MAIERKNAIVRSAFKFSVPVNFRHEFKSPSFMAGGVPWKIHFRKIFKQPHPRVVGRILVQAYLVCDFDAPNNNNWSITSGCVLRMMKLIENPQPTEQTVSMQTFRNGHRMNELMEFQFWQEQADEKFHFTHDHQFRFEATIMTNATNNISISKDSNPFDINSTTICQKIEKIFENGSIFSLPFELGGIFYGLEFIKSMESLDINLHVKADEYFGLSVSIRLNAKIISFDSKLMAFEKSLQFRLVVGSQVVSIWKPLIKWHSNVESDAYTQMENVYVQVTMAVGMWQPLFLADENAKINQITMANNKM